MANKNTKARKAAYIKANKKSGFPKSGYKRKAKPFPRPNQDEDVSLRAQDLMFHGANSLHNKIKLKA